MEKKKTNNGSGIFSFRKSRYFDNRFIPALKHLTIFYISIQLVNINKVKFGKKN